MKKIYRFFAFIFVFVIAAVVFTACSRDEFEFPSSEPRITGDQDLRSLPGATLNISVLITDPVGVSVVSLTYPDWGVAEVRNLSDALTNYNFTFDLVVPNTATVGSIHEMTVLATNLNGIEKSFTIRLTLDADITMPTINNLTPTGIAFLATGDDLTLEIEATDDMEIATFSINGSNISDVLTVNANSYTYRKKLDIQVEGIYDFEVVVTDNDGNQAQETIQIAAFKPFEKMYLADVSTDEELNNDLMGVPMLIDNLSGDSLGKVFVARYYNATANTPVRFLSNNETFSNLTIGVAEPGQLKVGNGLTPIV